eukprot:1786203-Prymnesium_polylepis.1
MERRRETGDSASQLVPDDTHAGEIMEQLREMGEAVPERQRAPDYHTALSGAAVVIGDLPGGETSRGGVGGR